MGNVIILNGWYKVIKDEEKRLDKRLEKRAEEGT